MRQGDRGAPKIRYRWNLALHRFAGAALASVCDGGLIRGGSPMKIELNHVLHLANAPGTLAGLVIIGAGLFSWHGGGLAGVSNRTSRHIGDDAARPKGEEADF